MIFSHSNSYPWAPLQICWLCKASKGASDVTMTFTDITDQAPWRSTFLQEEPWDIEPAYARIYGFNILMVVPDLLHCWNLGVCRDMVASVLKVVLGEATVFDGATINDRFDQATKSLKTYARNHGHSLRLKKLTRKKITWAARKYPEFRGSGSDCHVVAAWLEELLVPHSRVYGDFCTLLWAGNKSNWFLTPAEKRTTRTLGKVFTQTLLRLARGAIDSQSLMWRVKPKLHLMCHVFEGPRQINVARYATWMDEDWLKKIAKVMQLTSVKTAQKRVLQRWLMAFKSHMEKMRN